MGIFLFILVSPVSFWLLTASFLCSVSLCFASKLEALFREDPTQVSWLFGFIMWEESETESVRGRDYGNGVLSSSKHGVKTDGFELRGQSWYVR